MELQHEQPQDLVSISLQRSFCGRIENVGLQQDGSPSSYRIVSAEDGGRLSQNGVSALSDHRSYTRFP